MSRIICISNRVSLPDPETGEIKAGGLAVGVKAALENHGGGLWFGWDGSVLEPDEKKRTLSETVRDDITFLTLPLTRKEYDEYYKAMANENLWPMMHELGQFIEARVNVYATYKRVNKMLARLIRPYIRPGDVLWVHDYHLIPLGRELRALGVGNRIGYYHHIPMPGLDFINGPAVPLFLKSCFWDLLKDFFSYDLVGFQSFRDFKNLIGSLPFEAPLPDRYSAVSLRLDDKKTDFGIFPISIETIDLVRDARENRAQHDALARDKARYQIILGAERLDYTKGIPFRLEGYYKFLRRNPMRQGEVKYHQISPLSRSDIHQYKNTIHATRAWVHKIRTDFGRGGWNPLEYSENSIPRAQLIAGMRHADVGLVTPLIDGQNLVAKEYIAAQDPRDPGMLVLSKNAGAAEELSKLGVLCVDPYDSDDIAAKIKQALETPLAQRMEIYRRCIAHLYRYDISHWAERFLDTLSQVQRKPATRSQSASQPYTKIFR